MSEPVEGVEERIDGESARPGAADPTAPYQTSGTPTGGPGPWPTMPPTGEALDVFEALVRQAGEPPVRFASRVLLTLVVVLVVVLGSLAYRDLDDRADEADRRVDVLDEQVADLEEQVGSISRS